MTSVQTLKGTVTVADDITIAAWISKSIFGADE